MRKVIGFLLMAMLATGAAWANPITIDGDFLDWDGIAAADVGNVAEELGDMPTGPEFDIQDFYITHDTSFVYVRIDIDPSATYEDGFLNYTNAAVYELWFGTDLRDTVGLGWGGFWTFAPDYRIDMGPAIDPTVAASQVTVYRYASDFDGSEELYDSVAVADIAVTDNKLEIAVPRSAIANTPYGGWLFPMCYYVGDEIWDNEEYFPNGAAEDGTPYYALAYIPGANETMDVVVGGGDWRMDDISIDGDMLDWDAIPLATTGLIAETTGDSPSGPEADLYAMKLASDSTYFYGYLAIDPAATFTDAYLNYTNPPVLEMYFDASLGDTTGLTWGWWPFSVNFITELYEATNSTAPADTATVYNYVSAQSPAAAEWGDNFQNVGNAMVAVNGDDNALEFAIPWDILNVGNVFGVVVSSLNDYVWGSEDFIPNDWNNTGGPAYQLTYSRVDGASVTYRIADPNAGSVGHEPIAGQLPKGYTIVNTFPNPFNSTTRITYQVPATGHVEVAVYDVMGRIIATLQNGVLPAGTHRTIWNGQDLSGHAVSSGVYFVKVGGEYGRAVARMVYVK